MNLSKKNILKRKNLVKIKIIKGFKRYVKFSDPKSENCTLKDFLVDFDFSFMEILEDIGRKPDLENWENENLVLLLKNDFNKEKALEDNELKVEVKEQIKHDCNYIEIDLNDQINKIIRCCRLNEFPTIFIIKKELLIDFRIKPIINFREKILD